ncbi:hypothetical protein LQV05_003918 [Cryptococcus neoformans]|nr:hypothetical protein LQV05_003918 [Cryptococcus neoformans]
MPVDVPSELNFPPVPSNQVLMVNSVISMENLKIKVLPSIVNACLIVIILSAGNAFTFNTTRSLHALALDGKAPRILTRLSRHGVPYTCCVVVMLLTCPSYLALGSSSKVALNWILKSQPYAGLGALLDRVVHLDSGLRRFLKGNWDVATFIFNYSIIALVGGIGLGFKIFARTLFHRSNDVDLKTDLDFFDAIDSYYQDLKDDHSPITF